MNRTVQRRIGLILGWIGALLLTLAALPTPMSGLSQSAQPGNQAGLVVRFSDNEVVKTCIDLGPDGQATGEEVLRSAGLDLRLAYDAGAGAAVCKINLLGCNFPQESCFCQCTLAAGATCVYWAYFHLIEGRWVFANQGASSYIVRAGSVEGWSWGEGQIGATGTQPPALSFEQICTAATSPTETRTPTATLLPPAQIPPTETPTIDPALITPSATTTPSPSPTATETPTPTPSATATFTPSPTRTATAPVPAEDTDQAPPDEPPPTELATVPPPTEPPPTAESVPTLEQQATVESYPAFTEIQPTEERTPDVVALASSAAETAATAGRGEAIALPLVRGPAEAGAIPESYPITTAAPSLPAPTAVAVVAPTPRLLPTAGIERKPEQAQVPGPGGNYLFFGLMVVALASTIIWLNMRREDP